MSDFRSIVFFDLETTGLDTDVCDIIQLSAVCGEDVFNAFTLPGREITKGAQRVTGLSVRDGVLYQREERVDTVPLVDVLTSFIAFLRRYNQQAATSLPLVVGHNIRNFDCRPLARVLDELNLRAEFDAAISGCVDTLPLAREMLKDRKSYRQGDLVRDLLGKEYKAHDALEDVRALQDLYHSLQPPQELIAQYTFTLDSM